jgi:hypothetical protein
MCAGRRVSMSYGMIPRLPAHLFAWHIALNA